MPLANLQMMPMLAYQNPDHEGNHKVYRTGKECIEKGCKQPAGTAWCDHWCFDCNVKRIDKITKRLEDIDANWSTP